MTEKRELSVVIACHTQDRWDLIVKAIDSVLQQDGPSVSIVVSVDHEPVLYERLKSNFPDIEVVENQFQGGASGNRNSGVLATSTALVAFLDDDASAKPGWLMHLTAIFEDPEVICAGGSVNPAWEVAEPRWFPFEFAWVIGASHTGLPTANATVRNVWSENMVVRRNIFDEVGGFRLDFGKVGTTSRPEDTDLCLRMQKAAPNGAIMYVPDAKVDHHVSKERGTFQFFLKRCYSEGRGKVELASNNEGTSDLGDEQAWIRQTITRGFVRYMKLGIVERNPDQILRGGALICGMAAAGIGATLSVFRMLFG
ncbi:MAG TPA: glycosyltransferase [Acidimicrobiales bacterium]|jgi:GT2 family glycosyltransferase|nr:glycosyltransferase [Acidimicrobiales bacterium]